LDAAHQALLEQLKRADFPTGLGIDIEGNGLELVTPDPAKVEAAVRSGALKLPPFVKVTRGQPGIIP
jgi:hypothetical protein